MRGKPVGRALAAGMTAVCLFGLARSVSAQGGAGWPQTLTVNGAKIVVHQPQAIEWPDHRRLATREALAITQAGAKVPVLGTMEVSFATYTDALTSDVSLSDPRLLAVHFAIPDSEQAARLEEQVKTALSSVQPAPVPLATVLLTLRQTPEPVEAALNNDPPAIFHSDGPASLIVLDGEPVTAPVGQSGLSFVVNTNWDLFTDGESWYLLNNGNWMTADSYTGPYQPINRLPRAFSLIPADANFSAARNAIPPPVNNPLVVPAVMVSTKPAEIIVTSGAPLFQAVRGTGLQAVRNTNSVLLFDPSGGRFFLLLSGRWFAATDLDGPWSFASNELPADFARIAPEDPQARVLASVPGTRQAQVALRLALVPRLATLKKDQARLTVTYAGSPVFEPIAGTSMRYAVNTSFQVIEAGGRYYVCYQGAWFEGSEPTGGWALAERVPESIYSIPPASPLYNVSFVQVFGVTPATVTYGYTGGYNMSFPDAGVVVHGTGYYYPPAVFPGRVPVYYSHPYSYAGNVGYNTSTGAWATGGAVYAPFGGPAKAGTTYNPIMGAYGTGSAIYGPHGGVGGFSYYKSSTGGYARDNAFGSYGGDSANAGDYHPRMGMTQNATPYYRWGSGTLASPNGTAERPSGRPVSSFLHVASTQALRGANDRPSRAGLGRDVYAGDDGNAYQHSSKGWRQWRDGGWRPIDPMDAETGTESSTYSQLEQDRAGRAVAPEGSAQGGRAMNTRCLEVHGTGGQDQVTLVPAAPSLPT